MNDKKKKGLFATVGEDVKRFLNTPIDTSTPVGKVARFVAEAPAKAIEASKQIPIIPSMNKTEALKAISQTPLTPAEAKARADNPRKPILSVYDVGYRIPREGGKRAADLIESGVRQIGSKTPSKIGPVSIPYQIAAPTKIALGGLSLTTPAVAGQYIYEPTTEGVKSVFPETEHTPIPQIAGLLASIVGTGALMKALHPTTIPHPDYTATENAPGGTLDTTFTWDEKKGEYVKSLIGGSNRPDGKAQYAFEVAMKKHDMKAAGDAVDDIKDPHLKEYLNNIVERNKVAKEATDAAVDQPAFGLSTKAGRDPMTIYRAVDSTDGRSVLGKGKYFVFDRTDATRYGSNIVPMELSPDAKMLNLSDTQKLQDFTDEAVKQYQELYRTTLKSQGEDQALGTVMRKLAELKGYDGIIGDDKAFGSVVFNDKFISPINVTDLSLLDRITSRAKFYAGDTADDVVARQKEAEFVAQEGQGLPDLGLSVKAVKKGKQLKDSEAIDVATAVKNLSDDAPVDEKYAFNVNKLRLNISDVDRARLDDTVKILKPQLEAVKGLKLSDEDVINAAQQSEVLRNIVTRDETEAFNAAVLKTRQLVAKGATDPGISKEYLDALRVQSSLASDWGRRGRAFAINADPATVGIKEQLVKELIKAGEDGDKVLKASEGVDFNNPKQATEFYRQFVQPTFGEKLEEYRYINLLSSPQTHVVNAFSNAIQATVLDPATKLVSGATDWVTSGLTGSDRTHYVAEVPAYYKGSISSIPDATSKFFKVLRGQEFGYRPDVSQLGTGDPVLSKAEIVPRLLEASDVFFRSIIKGGEQEAFATKFAKNGVDLSPEAIDSLAQAKAAYYVFHKAPDAANLTGQGAVLSWIDKFTDGVYTLRKVPGVKWFIPFIQTPMNILKQGFEYSPLGFSTMIGNTDKIDAFSKAAIGSMVFLGASQVAQTGDSTWAAPIGEKEKQMFYSTGRKPYSLKVGDQWISYSKLGPLSYPIALASAAKYYSEQSPQSLTDTGFKKMEKTILGLSGFFSDQSYLEGIGSLVDTLSGETYAFERAIGNVPRQLIPLSSLQSWVNRVLDPVYRQPKNIKENLQIGIVGQSQNVAPHTDMYGRPQYREYPLFNVLSPLGVSPAKDPQAEYVYQINQTKKKVQNVKTKVKSGEISPTKARQILYEIQSRQGVGADGIVNQ